MTVLFIENDDSFSFNVVDLLPGPVRVVRGPVNDRDLLGVRVVVMGPGPTDPLRAGLVEVVTRVARAGVPFLGVCLGHQALGLAFGAQLIRSRPVHGHVHSMQLGASRYWPGGRFDVMRYHSLSLTGVHAPLVVTGQLDDGTVMAIEHETLPMAGVQFHPDSYGTPSGRALVESFFERVS